MTSWTLRTLDDPQEFLTRAEGLLLRHEAANGLLWGVAQDALHTPDLYPEGSRCILVEGPTGPLLAAVRTPPHGWLVGAGASPDLLRWTLEALFRADGPAAALVPESLGTEYSAALRSACGLDAKASARQRLYRAERVQTPAGVPGALRLASPSDSDLIEEWVVAFEREASDRAHTQREHVRPKVRAFVESKAAVLWETERGPVSMAVVRGPTPRGIRVGYVYTPPSHRGRGYGSACTAAATQRELSGGRSFCFLYADQANPTSNRIYRAIGYEAVDDVAWWEPQNHGT